MVGKDMHSKGTHSLIGAGAIILGVALGIGVVYWDGANERTLVVQAQASDCPSFKKEYPYGPDNYDSTGKKISGTDGQQGHPCKHVPVNGGVCEGKCAGSLCSAGTSCNGEKLEGKPKEMPKEMGGMPPMLPMLPMPMPKMPMPEMPKEPCGPLNALGTSSAGCAGRDTPSGISAYLSSLFGGNTASSTGNAVSSTIRSVADRLSEFLSGDTESSDTVKTNTGTQNPKEASTTPVVVSGSNAGGINAPGGIQGGTNAGQGVGAGGTFSVVTGFGSGGANVETSTGPILAAIKSVTARIQAILSSMF
jgi:hypothetical protein